MTDNNPCDYHGHRSGPEHFAFAENLLQQVADDVHATIARRALMTQMALAHATLAETALAVELSRVRLSSDWSNTVLRVIT